MRIAAPPVPAQAITLDRKHAPKVLRPSIPQQLDLSQGHKQHAPPSYQPRSLQDDSYGEVLGAIDLSIPLKTLRSAAATKQVPATEVTAALQALAAQHSGVSGEGRVGGR
jgi:hypothetical protein